MSDTLETTGAVDAEGLSRQIAVVGLAVSEAAEELQHAAERLMAAEEQARDAEHRARIAEEQLAQGATTVAELLVVVEQTREGQMDTEERAERAELRLELMSERSRLMEEHVKELEAKIEECGQQQAVTVIVGNDERAALQEAIAAEVRRPLTSILGLTLAIKHADPKSADAKDMLRQLSTNARKLDRLVAEMLDVDRIASGTYEPNTRRTDLEALARRVMEESPDLANRDVRVQTEHVAAEVDPPLTEQMVEILLANAGRRTAPGSTVWLKLSSDRGGVVIAVDDTGPEVPAGLRQAMFASATENGTAVKQTRGTTGLSLLSKLAEIHGGRAWVEERPGGGASFRVFLPSSAMPVGETEDEERGALTLLEEADPDIHEFLETTAAIGGGYDDEAIAI